MQLEQAICLAALRETAQQARRSRTHLQDFIALQVTCPACPDHPEMPLTGSIPSWKVAELSPPCSRLPFPVFGHYIVIYAVNQQRRSRYATPSI